jgi:hypothetical protein
MERMLTNLYNLKNLYFVRMSSISLKEVFIYFASGPSVIKDV